MKRQVFLSFCLDIGWDRVEPRIVVEKMLLALKFALIINVSALKELLSTFFAFSKTDAVAQKNPSSLMKKAAIGSPFLSLVVVGNFFSSLSL